MRKTVVFGIIIATVLMIALPAFGGDNQRPVQNKYGDCCCKPIAESPTVSQQCARKIMGDNFFGIEEAVKYYQVNPTRQDLAILSEIPFTKATLEKCKNTHILVAVFPLSILEMRAQVKHGFSSRRENTQYNYQAFVKSEGETGWQLVRKTPVMNSLSKTWSEQQALLGKDEKTPTAQVMVYTIIGHYLATGERLFRNLCVRCLDMDPATSRVCVGFFRENGLHVDYYEWDNFREYLLGLASSRKPAGR